MEVRACVTHTRSSKKIATKMQYNGNNSNNNDNDDNASDNNQH
jgi:hypothetical protein